MKITFGTRQWGAELTVTAEVVAGREPSACSDHDGADFGDMGDLPSVELLMVRNEGGMDILAGLDSYEKDGLKAKALVELEQRALMGEDEAC